MSARHEKRRRAPLSRRRDPRASTQRPRRLVERVEPLRRREEDPHERRLGHRRRAAALAHHADARCHAHHPRAQHLARRAVRPLDQSLSRLRAWLHLLLRAAHPRLSRPVARPRFRDQDPVQARGGEAARGRARLAEVSLRRGGDGHQHRSLPAGRARTQDHAFDPEGALRLQQSGRHRHQEPSGHARHRHSRRHGQAQPCRGLPVGDHARQGAGAGHGTARLGAAPPARRRSASSALPASRPA